MILDMGITIIALKSKHSIDILVKREKVDNEDTGDCVGSDEDNERKEEGFVLIGKESTCNRCKRVITVLCLIPCCPCFENAQSDCIKYFNGTHEAPKISILHQLSGRSQLMAMRLLKHQIQSTQQSILMEKGILTWSSCSFCWSWFLTMGRKDKTH
uniref:Phorbol-ester/DAG-type domain-containing protein n=1 Tax=Strongyloides papillosus TaxID=174720 RepID=A0A0N5CBF0_STREA